MIHRVVTPELREVNVFAFGVALGASAVEGVHTIEKRRSGNLVGCFVHGQGEGEGGSTRRASSVVPPRDHALWGSCFFFAVVVPRACRCPWCPIPVPLLPLLLAPVG